MLDQELAVLSLCNSENVVKMIEFLEGDQYLYLVMEFCNCNQFKSYFYQSKKEISTTIFKRKDA